MKTAPTHTLFVALALLAGCATQRPLQLAPPSFQASAIQGFETEAPDRLVVNDGLHFWRLHLQGACPLAAQAGYLVFLDEMELKQWPLLPEREGYGPAPGWPANGKYVNRNSDRMQVSSNGMTWVHPFSAQGTSLYGTHVPYGCQVDRVEPLWH